MAPTVSVIVPTYNRAALLREALESVRAQTYADWECIVVDDGSTDGTAAMLAALDEPRLRVLALEHCGNVATLRNAAITAARGAYLAFLDSDDLWGATKLERQVTELAGGVRWCYCGWSLVDAGGFPLRGPGRECDLAALRAGWVLDGMLGMTVSIGCPMVVAERALILEVGGFDERVRYCEDTDLWLRLAERAEVGVVREPLAIIREHDDRGSRTPVAPRRHIAAVYARCLRRLRDPALRRLCRRRVARAYADLSAEERRHGHRSAALRSAMRAVMFAPASPRSLRALAGALLGRRPGRPGAPS